MMTSLLTKRVARLSHRSQASAKGKRRLVPRPLPQISFTKRTDADRLARPVMLPRSRL
ncbi:hypothetical protein IG631_24180 [Alternaria alternata]|nr:hypothetical protein IG631_24180 [Alternaria alternata]